MSLLKDAFNWIKDHGQFQTTQIHGRIVSDRELYAIKAPTSSVLQVHTLTALVEYIQSEFDTNEPLLIHIKDPETVTVMSKLNNDQNRNHYIQASTYVPSFRFDSYYDPEDINIKLQSVFVPNKDQALILKMVGNLKEDNVRGVGDDGISQAVTMKTGVATVADVKVVNPVTLAPYRTFIEVDQPESKFVLRMQNGPRVALFEADGGAWKNEAIRNIEDYLMEALAEYNEADKLTIIA
ncbi:hypothetical protein [Exiguobacterium sp. UBA5002]|uniref:hypothetical protein n=1 Tax=Exiguobacterium sp. UBA5002 TaxID=1946497 RepID=UPI0025BBE2F8|nr:hypothetical protein [Exiguobacterium sp. UBA5002]